MYINQFKVNIEYSSESNITQPALINDIKKQNYLGSGGYNKVYKAKNSKSSASYAAKIIKDEINDSTSDKELMDLTREVIISSQLNHPSILKYKGYSPVDFKQKQRPVIFTEYAMNGTLDDLIWQERESPNKKITDTQKLIILYGIASGISYLHKHNILHRDLKPSNILIDDFLFPKIADFGLSVQLNKSIQSLKDDVKGTLIYMAPEIFRKAEYSKASDVYAFSMIVYELITNQIPYEGIGYYDLLSKLSEKIRPNFENPILDSFRKLIESCWDEEPSNRPTMDEIINALKSDRNFITENVDEKKYKLYIDYIEKYNCTFNQSKVTDFLDIFQRFSRYKISQNIDERIDYSSADVQIYPLEEFDELNSKCQEMIVKAVNDPFTQFLVGKYLIEGQELFPQNHLIGVKYLKESIKSGILEAAIYYCKILIKGNIFQCDINKAKIIADKYVKCKDLGQYYYLYGKICSKENKPNESREFYKKSISLNNSESMYEFGRLIFASNKEEGIQYYLKAIENGCIEAMYK